MTSYAVDFSSIRWIFIYDDREVYSMVRRLGNTVDRPAEIAKSAPLLNTLSRPPPKAVFVLAARAHSLVSRARAASTTEGIPAIFGQSNIAHRYYKQIPETLYILHKRNFQKTLDIFIQK